MNKPSTAIILSLVTSGWTIMAAEPDLSKLPPPAPLTAEQVGLVRAWIDQGAK